MLFADKKALERQLEVDLIGIRQKELDHYTHCCLTLSAPAALLAGFAYTALVQVEIPPGTSRVTEATFYSAVVLAMVCEVAAVVKVTLIALCGPNLALRGPPGSMSAAVDAMRPAFFRGMTYFWVGLFCFHVSAAAIIWLNASVDIATFGSGLIVLTSAAITTDIRATLRQFAVPRGREIDGKFGTLALGLGRADTRAAARALIARLQRPQRESSFTSDADELPAIARVDRGRLALGRVRALLMPRGAAPAPPRPSASLTPPPPLKPPVAVLTLSSPPAPPPRSARPEHALSSGGPRRAPASTSPPLAEGVARRAPAAAEVPRGEGDIRRAQNEADARLPAAQQPSLSQRHDGTACSSAKSTLERHHVLAPTPTAIATGPAATPRATVVVADTLRGL
jgi:hypothetical protein